MLTRGIGGILNNSQGYGASDNRETGQALSVRVQVRGLQFHPVSPNRPRGLVVLKVLLGRLA